MTSIPRLVIDIPAHRSVYGGPSPASSLDVTRGMVFHLLRSPGDDVLADQKTVERFIRRSWAVISVDVAREMDMGALTEKVRAWQSDIGPDRLSDAYRHLKDLNSKTAMLALLESDLELLRQAEPGPVEGVEMVWSNWLSLKRDGGYSDVYTLASEVASAALHEAGKTLAPVFAFACNPVHFSLTGKEVREHYLEEKDFMEEEGDRDLTAFMNGIVFDCLENALSDFADVGVSDLDDVEVLGTRIVQWAPHAGDGSPEDLALDGFMENWSARQTVRTFMPDTGRIFPIVREGVPAPDKETILREAEALVQEWRQHCQAFEDSWSEAPKQDQDTSASPSF